MNKSLLLFKVIYVLLPIFIGKSIIANGQNASPDLISSAGNFYMNSDSITMSWSIGEVITGTIESNSNILTQGFHQNKYDIIEDINELH